MTGVVVLLVVSLLVALTNGKLLSARDNDSTDHSAGNSTTVHKGESFNCSIEGPPELGEIVCDNGNAYKSEDHDALWSSAFFRDASVSTFCVLFAGLMSGLTIGLMSLDMLTLRIAAQSTAPEDALKSYRARRVLPLLRKRHWLLCTLLISNAAAMEALPIFLDRIVGEVAAIIISVSAVLVFGEIVPQALFLKYALPVGSFLREFLWALIFLLSPLGWPLSKLIDLLLGEGHQNMYRRNELRELIGMHAGDALEGESHGTSAEQRVADMRKEIQRLQSLGLRQQYHAEDDDGNDEEESSQDQSPEGQQEAAKRRAERRKKRSKKEPAHGAGEHEAPLTSDEARIIRGVLDMNSKLARDVMTPMDKLDALDSDARLDQLTLRELRKQAKQYFAVRRKGGGVAGVLLATSLIGITPSDSPSAITDLLLPLSVMPDTMPLYDALNALRRGNLGRMALVCDHTDSNKALGILTLDDIVGTMLQSEEITQVITHASTNDDIPDVPIPLRKHQRDGSNPTGYRNTSKRRGAKLDIVGAIPLLNNRVDENDND